MLRAATQRHDECDPDARGGFALIEVMLALVLIAVLAALALPAMRRATGPAALRMVAFQVAAVLREDRNLSQSSGRPVDTSVGQGGTRIYSGGSAASIRVPAGATAGTFDKGVPVIRFFGDGRSSGGGIVIASATMRYIVAVSRDTGAIRVREP